VSTTGDRGRRGAADESEESLVRREDFLAEYDKLLARWPSPSPDVDLTSEFGSTRVHVSGPVDAPAVVMFHAYQATSAEWVEVARLLAGERRIYAVDMMGDAGHSVPGDRAIVSPDDMVTWIDTVLDGLGLEQPELVGHSYGAWIALTYGLQRPERVGKLTLLDPTMCFAPLLPAYVIRATPTLLRPTSARRRSLVRWESRGKTIDPEWLELTAAASELEGPSRTVPTKIPSAATVATLKPQSLVIVAGASRVHHVKRVGGNAAERLPAAGWKRSPVRPTTGYLSPTPNRSRHSFSGKGFRWRQWVSRPCSGPSASRC
jgi:pimeloyl-ACP methyl ester carboxylesterase